MLDKKSISWIASRPAVLSACITKARAKQGLMTLNGHIETFAKNTHEDGGEYRIILREEAGFSSSKNRSCHGRLGEALSQSAFNALWVGIYSIMNTHCECVLGLGFIWKLRRNGLVQQQQQQLAHVDYNLFAEVCSKISHGSM